MFRIIAIFFLLAAACLYIVINHSVSTRELICKGHWRDKPAQAETAYVQLNEFRPWVKLWSRKTGYVVVQTEKLALAGYIPAITKTFDGRLALYGFHDYDYTEGKLGKFRGGYRAANREITIEFSPTLVFVGSCDG